MCFKAFNLLVERHTATTQQFLPSHFPSSSEKKYITLKIITCKNTPANIDCVLFK